MSRSYCRYDEDWQRRKSILIRSLFHDLPILSPVPEESDDSYVPVRSYEPLEEPQRPYSPLPPLIIERVPKINKHDEPDEYYKKLLIKIKRIYHILFILNRNLSSDEEFFSDNSMTDDDDDLNTPLANKNDDNLDLNSPDNHLEVNTDDHGLDSHIIEDINDPVDQAEEFNDLDDNKDDSQNQVNDNTNSNEENVRKSSNSNVSNGYRADSESIDTVIVDILNYTKSTNGETSTKTTEASKASKDLEEESESMSSEGEDESNPDNTEEGLSGDEKAGDNVSYSTNEEDYSEELIVEEETNVSSTSNQETDAMLITDRRIQSTVGNIEETNEQEVIEEESNDKSITNQGVKTKSNSNTEENILESHQTEELIEIRSEEEIRNERITNQSSKCTSFTEERNVSHQEGIDTLRQEEQNRFEDLNKSRMNIKTANEEETDNSSTSDEEWDGEESESLEVEISVELSASALEEIENAQELEGEGRRIAVVSPEPEIMDDDEVEVVSDIGSHYRQITTVAMVHAAVAQDFPDIDSQVYEGSPKSIILPVRRMKRTAAQAMLDRREESVGEGRNKEPRTEATTTHSNDESTENIEEMRSQNRKLSQATNSKISQESVSEESNEFIRSSHDVTDVTSSSQDGGNFNISKRKTSDDLGEIMARILNESRDNVENINLCRKRKNFEDISVQTSESVSWDDIRKELFVGAPKIVRLCSCVDHVCQ